MTKLKVVDFLASDEDQQAVIAVLERALDLAKRGEIIDVAVAASIRDGDGPQMFLAYHGKADFATLCAAVQSLQFDMHYRRYQVGDE